MNIPIQSFDQQFYTGDTYFTKEQPINIFSKLLPNLSFYISSLLGPVLGLCYAAQINKCDDVAWVYNSARMGRVFEAVGCRFSITGMDNLKNLTEPCIIVGNHMSTLETFILPSVIRPHMPVTFVVKQSLADMPLFGKILETRDVIVVGRTNPRQDLQNMLNEGKKRLDNGMSLVIFPQSTRSNVFNVAKFNSIGVKLARKAQKPIIPLALKTDTWAQGKIVKDFGPLHIEKTIHLAFGAPIYVQDQGKAEHVQICEFIKDKLDSWS